MDNDEEDKEEFQESLAGGTYTEEPRMAEYRPSQRPYDNEPAAGTNRGAMRLLQKTGNLRPQKLPEADEQVYSVDNRQRDQVKTNPE